jgi:MOSC domain-containing protein YiiM
MSSATIAGSGRVHQISRKPETGDEHGLPKLPTPVARVTPAGLEGDFNRWRHEVKNDDNDMALLILPQETLEELNEEGWPVRAGDLGENITTEGIAYDSFAPGRRFRVGESVIEISKPCTPCDNLYLLPYVGEARGPTFVQAMLGRRGWYARVLLEGRVHTGDPVEPIPEARR